MFHHLPIAILAALSPVAISDKVRKFDISKECRFEVVRPISPIDALRTKLMHFPSLRPNGLSLSVPTGAVVWLRRRSAVSQATSSCWPVWKWHATPETQNEFFWSKKQLRRGWTQIEKSDAA